MLLKFSVFPIMNGLAHLLILTKKQERNWMHDLG